MNERGVTYSMTNNDVYFVGTMIDKKDFSDEFIEKGQWQLGWVNQEDNGQYQKMLALLNEIKIDDVVILKSTYTRTHDLPFENPNGKSVSVMKLKKLGHVKQNPHDGHNLFIDWESDFQPREWYFYTNRQTIWKVSNSDKIDDASQLIQFALHNIKQDYSYFLDKSGLIANAHKTNQTELQKRKQDFLNFYDQGKWTAVIPKANWLSGYWDDKQNYQKIKLVSIRQLLSYITSLTATENEALKLIPDNLFTITTSDEFVKISDVINSIILNHRQEVDALIDSLNIVEGNGRHGWGYSNFKKRNWYKEYQKYLSQHDRKGDTNMQLKGSSLLINSKNIILRGAPGTGKTFLAKSMAADIISNGETTDLNNLTEEQQNQIGFVQFHPSYDYTDFVEGLRPTGSGTNVGFELVPGIFKAFCEKAYKPTVNSIDNFEQSWDKFVEEMDEKQEIEVAPGYTYHPSESWEADGGIMRTTDKGYNQYINKSQLYKVYRGLPGVPKRGHDNFRKKVLQFMKDHLELLDFKAAEGVNDKPYIFIIDEINRAEISKVLGELFFSIDPEYRGPKNGVLTQYSNLHDDKDEKFFIPKNVYIIGTMNDIDRSVDIFDFAMRRRFTFIEITAKQSADNMLNNDDTKNLMARLNQALVDKNKGGLTRDYEIGASYFKPIDGAGASKEIIEPLWDNKLQPLLIDYFRGEHEAEKKIKLIEDAYFAIQEED